MKRLLFFLFLLPFAASAQYGAEVDFESGAIKDSIYSEYFKTVLLYPHNNNRNENIVAPVTDIFQTQKLRLEFDELTEDYTNYMVKIIHCNADWTKSQMNDIEYLDDYNEFPITFYRASFNTRVNYTHYQFDVPKVKLPGNYILVVYYQDEPELIALTRKFQIYDSKLQITLNNNLTAGMGAATEGQLVQFSVSYPDYPILNPMDNIKVYVRKNQRNNLCRKYEPTFINEGTRTLTYNNITDAHIFPGGNEYRKTDIRSTNFGGFNVGKVQNQDTIFQLSTRMDKFQISDAYRYWDDINGQYVIDHYEWDDGEVHGDYVKMFFQVRSSIEQVGDVYLFGAFTDWKIDPRYKMQYYPPNQYYWANVKLKQGYYNYKYVIKRPEGKVDEYFLDGNHFETENLYEIFVYYKPVGQREELLLGYKKFNFNQRN